MSWPECYERLPIAAILRLYHEGLHSQALPTPKMSSLWSTVGRRLATPLQNEVCFSHPASCDVLCRRFSHECADSFPLFPVSSSVVMFSTSGRFIHEEEPARAKSIRTSVAKGATKAKDPQKANLRGELSVIVAFIITLYQSTACDYLRAMSCSCDNTDRPAKNF